MRPVPLIRRPNFGCYDCEFISPDWFCWDPRDFGDRRPWSCPKPPSPFTPRPCPRPDVPAWFLPLPPEVRKRKDDPCLCMKSNLGTSARSQAPPPTTFWWRKLPCWQWFAVRRRSLLFWGANIANIANIANTANIANIGMHSVGREITGWTFQRSELTGPAAGSRPRRSTVCFFKICLFFNFSICWSFHCSIISPKISSTLSVEQFVQKKPHVPLLFCCRC